jgi:hypothetical protein
MVYIQVQAWFHVERFSMAESIEVHFQAFPGVYFNAGNVLALPCPAMPCPAKPRLAKPKHAPPRLASPKMCRSQIIPTMGAEPLRRLYAPSRAANSAAVETRLFAHLSAIALGTLQLGRSAGEPHSRHGNRGKNSAAEDHQCATQALCAHHFIPFIQR